MPLVCFNFLLTWLLAHLLLFPMWALSAGYLCAAPWTGVLPISFTAQPVPILSPSHYVPRLQHILKDTGLLFVCMCLWDTGGSYLTLLGSLDKFASSQGWGIEGGRDVGLAMVAFSGLCMALEQFVVAERLDKQQLLKSTVLHLVKC